LLFSDGVTEAMNSANDEYGDDRLIEVLRANRHRNPQDIIATVTEDVSKFVAGAPSADDLTLVVAKRVVQ
jgi:sigma-B regulation protein RsbU (phosphoserine phosphatase)